MIKYFNLDESKVELESRLKCECERKIKIPKIRKKRSEKQKNYTNLTKIKKRGDFLF